MVVVVRGERRRQGKRKKYGEEGESKERRPVTISIPFFFFVGAFCSISSLHVQDMLGGVYIDLCKLFKILSIHHIGCY